MHLIIEDITPELLERLKAILLSELRRSLLEVTALPISQTDREWRQATELYNAVANAKLMP